MTEQPKLRESRGGLVCKWQERMLVHGEGDLHGKPYRLLPWHREFNWRWFELDPDAQMGPWWWLEALVGAERGAVKTELLAALAMTEMAGPDSVRNSQATPLVHIAAAALKQAGELFRQVQIMAGGAKGREVTTAPLSSLFEVLDTTISFADGRPGRIERVAAEAGTNEGGKTSLFLADELAEWEGRRAAVFDVLNAATTKRLAPGRTVGISMAGHAKGAMPFDDEDPLLWKMYSRGLLEAADPTSRYLFDWRAAPPVDFTDAASVEAALRAMRGADVTWSVKVRLREIMTRKISQRQAQRLYFCQWPARSADSWLRETPGIWTELHDDNATPADGSDVVVGVDMSLHGDHVGVIVAGYLRDGRVGWYPRSWAPDANGRIDHADVFATIAGALAQRWKIKAVTYDPRFFELPARLLEDQGFAVVEFPQSPERLIPADGKLHQLVLDHQLAVPDEPVLDAHADSAAWRESERGRYLSKGKSAGKMDLIRAGSMATWELVAGGAQGHHVCGFVDLNDYIEDGDW